MQNNPWQLAAYFEGLGKYFDFLLPRVLLLVKSEREIFLAKILDSSISLLFICSAILGSFRAF